MADQEARWVDLVLPDLVEGQMRALAGHRNTRKVGWLAPAEPVILWAVLWMETKRIRHP